MSITTGEVVHHLYQRGSALDLIPYYGVLPGRDELLECVGFGLPVCITCALPEALGGFTPLT